MIRGLNKVMIIGHLGRDPEMRYTPSGRPVTTFSVATNHTWSTSDGERRTETEWFNVVTWNNLAETCNQYLSKGAQVYIEGRLRTRRWQDAENRNHTSVEIIAQTMMILNEKQNPKNSMTEMNPEDDVTFDIDENDIDYS